MDESQPDPRTDFGHWCVIAAGLQYRTVEERQVILDRLSLTGQWEGVQSHWAHVLLEDIVAGDLTRVVQLQQACDLDRQRRGEGDDLFAEPPLSPSSTTLDAEPPAPLELPVDFRHQLHDERHVRTASSSVAVDGDFVARMSPDGATVAKPRSRQMATAPATIEPSVKATGRAMKWTVERYAEFAAALAVRTADHEGVMADFDMVPEAVATVTKGWGRKLDGDPILKAKYAAHYSKTCGELKG